MITSTTPEPPLDDNEYGSFGSDVEELEIFEQLLTHVEEAADIEDEPPCLRLPKVLGFEARPSETTLHDIPETKRLSKSPEPPVPEDRSPLERFRKPPRKALSVTDIVSPAWCELQYYYVLSKHGRKKRTPAMKRGTAVHQALEDEIHTTVPIEVTKVVDSWGLRIWNIIQGLRTLRETGRTRELAIWGMIGGEVVNGIIDELSYECPDPNHEVKPTHDELPEYQTTITEYLAFQSHGTRAISKEDRIYITDVKTRTHPTLPTGSSIRPTILQLHLYHHMLENLAQGNFQLAYLAQRYDLDVDEVFSDSFIAQLGSLNRNLQEVVVVTAAASSEGQPGGSSSQLSSTQESIDILLSNNNLASLWKYMMEEFRTTFIIHDHHHHQSSNNNEPMSTPQSISELSSPAEQPTRLSPLLTAEYLAPNYKHVSGRTKKSLGKKSFTFNAAYLKSYLEDSLQWWRGERNARGVEIQEAWKCRSCDFRDDCAWIQEKNAASINEALERKKMREIAGAETSGIHRSDV